MQRTATLKLLSLKKIGSRWEFQAESDTRLDKLLIQMFIPYRVTTTYPATQPGVKLYELNDEGMWLLSHLFANWTEMEAKATGKEASTGPTPCFRCGKADSVQVGRVCICHRAWLCEACYHIHVAEERATHHEPVCVECGLDVDLRRCPECENVYCDGRYGCYDAHECVAQRRYKYKACAACGPNNTSAPRMCPECGKAYCEACYNIGMRHACKRRKEQTNQHDIPTCATCGTPLMPSGRLCVYCSKSFCPTCMNDHTRICHKAHSSTYSQGASGSISYEDILRMQEEMLYSTYTDAFGGFGRFFHEFTQYARGNTASRTSGGTAASPIPTHVKQALTLLGLDTAATEEQIRTAFRAKVKARADGKGGYTGDMDALTKAKETALSWVKSS